MTGKGKRLKIIDSWNSYKCFWFTDIQVIKSLAFMRRNSSSWVQKCYHHCNIERVAYKIFCHHLKEAFLMLRCDFKRWWIMMIIWNYRFFCYTQKEGNDIGDTNIISRIKIIEKCFNSLYHELWVVRKIST